MIKTEFKGVINGKAGKAAALPKSSDKALGVQT